MKTIKDAVEFYKGKWPSKYALNVGWHESDNCWYAHYDATIDSDCDPKFTKEEFESYVINDGHPPMSKSVSFDKASGPDISVVQKVQSHGLYGHTPKPNNKYERVIKGKCDAVAAVDVYDVLKAFNVTCPALQHLIKKALCAGLRGHKDISTDLQDILSSAERAVELHEK